MAPSVVGWLKRTEYAFPQVKISDSTRFCRDYWRDFAKGDTETAIIEPKRAKAFFFTELKVAKQSAYLSGIGFRSDGAHSTVQWVRTSYQEARLLVRLMPTVLSAVDRL